MSSCDLVSTISGAQSGTDLTWLGDKFATRIVRYRGLAGIERFVWKQPSDRVQEATDFKLKARRVSEEQHPQNLNR